MEGAEQVEAPGAPLHVVVFPWLAFGHLIPFLELSKQLARHGYAVSFISTPRNIARLPPVPSGLSASVRLVSLPLPPVEGLPDGAESTADVPPEKVELLKAAFDGLAGPFSKFLAGACAGDGKKPDWIILDFAHYWLGPIAEEHQVPCAMLVIVTGTMFAYNGSRRENLACRRATVDDYMPMPPWCATPCTAIAFRRHEAAWIAAAYRPNASGVSDIERIWRTEERCRLLVFCSCPEVEPAGVFPLIADLFRKPAVPAGLLLPEPDGTVNSSDSSSSPPVLRCLGEQPAESVLYVALGTEAPVTVEGLHELARGIELSGVRFLWALRRPTSGAGAQSSPLLPDGFEARTRGRGTVCAGWVPQARVLSHAAVGAFLTHCGWGSVAESLRFGLRLVMLPFVVDQGLIARIMAERGVGVEVARREGDGWFGRDDVAAAVQHVMHVEEGKVFATNARKLKQLVLGDDGGRQERYVDELLDKLQRHRSQ